MDLRTWLAFALASLVLGLIPGPGVTSIVGYAISSGHRTALASVAGSAAGGVLAMTASLTGVGTLLAASATAFYALKLIGAAYLVVLGLLAILKSERGHGSNVPAKLISPRTAFLGNIAVGALNPKTIVFFVAFAPQFIDPHGGYALQAAILVATFSLVVGCSDTLYALLGSSAAGLLNTPSTMRWSKRVGGGALIAAGLATAAAKRA